MSQPFYFEREMKVYVHTKFSIYMFTEALFVIAKNWEQLQCPSTDKWTNKLYYNHTVECYSTIKEEKPLIHTTIWMTCKIIMLTDKIQTV